MQDNKRDPMPSGEKYDYSGTPNWNMDQNNVLASSYQHFDFSNVTTYDIMTGRYIEDGLSELPDNILGDEATMEADALELATQLDAFEAVKKTSDSPAAKYQPLIITHPKMLTIIGDWNFKASLVSTTEANCSYWRSKNRLYIKSGIGFTIKFERDVIKIDNVIEIYPVYEDENRSHVPVFRSDLPEDKGVVGVMDGTAYEDIEGMGGRHGVRLSATVPQVTLCLYKWDHKSKRNHLPVALYFILYDSELRCRGLDSMQVRVHEKPKRKCANDKRKLEADTMYAAQQTDRLKPNSERGTKRPNREQTYDSDDEPLINLASKPKTMKVEIELPMTMITKDILQSLNLRLVQAALSAQFPDRPIFERSSKNTEKILSQVNFNK